MAATNSVGGNALCNNYYFCGNKSNTGGITKYAVRTGNVTQVVYLQM